MAMLAGCGLPGFANFVGEVMVLFAAWKAYPVVTILACWGALVIGAVYMLRAVRAILHGPLPERWTGVADANPWRRLPFALLLTALLIFGCFPRQLTDRITTSAQAIVEQATKKTAAAGEPPVIHGTETAAR
jgi:NADH-quinone oxidoreductase subunit M